MMLITDEMSDLQSEKEPKTIRPHAKDIQFTDFFFFRGCFFRMFADGNNEYV